MIESFSKSGVVTIAGDQPHGLSDGDLVELEQVDDIPFFSKCGPVQVKQVFQTEEKSKRKIVIKNQFQLSALADGSKIPFETLPVWCPS